MAADWVLEARIIVKAEEAISNVEKLGDETEDMSIRAMFATDRFKKSMMALGIIAGTTFAAIVAWSPSLAAAFSLIRTHIGLASMAIGEEFAPMIMDNLVPAIEAFSGWVQGLNPKILQWIGLFLFLTVVTVAVLGVIALLVVSPLTLTILGIIAVVAFLIMLFTDWSGTMSFLYDNILILIGIIALIGIVLVAVFGWPIALAVLAIWGLIEVIRNFGDIMTWLGDFFSDMGDEIGRVFGDMKDEVGVQIEIIKAFIYGIVDFFSGLGTKIGDAASGIWDGMVTGAKDAISSIIGFLGDMFDTIMGAGGDAYGAIADVLSKVFTGIINTLAGFINNVFDGIQSAFDKIKGYVNKIPGVDWGGVNIPTIPTMHEGGIYDAAPEGLAMLKRGERVLTPSQDLGRSRGMGGGQTISNTYHITIQGGNFTSPQSRRTEVQQFMEEMKRSQQLVGYT